MSDTPKGNKYMLTLIRMPTEHKFLCAVAGLVVLVIVILFASGNVPPVPAMPSVLAGIASGLMTWLFTYAIATCLNQDDRRKAELVYDYVEKVFPNHRNETLNILNVVLGKSASLVNHKRGDLRTDFYRPHFELATHVHSLGIANKGLIQDLSQNRDHPLIQRLKRGTGIVVKVLLSNPECDFVNVRDRVEGPITGRTNPCSEDIQLQIDAIEGLARDHAGQALPAGNRLSVRLTKDPLSFAMTYVAEDSCPGTNGSKELLLLGVIFHHAPGTDTPMYQIPREGEAGQDSTLFGACLSSFDALFHDAQGCQVLVWDGTGCHFAPPHQGQGAPAAQIP